MSLDYRLGHIKDYEEVCYRKDPDGDGKVLNPVTQSLIFATIPLEMGEITEKNVDEFYTRLMIWEKTIGSLLTSKGQPISFPYDEVVKHIGLRTNVITRTRPAFWKNVHRSMEDDANRLLRQAKETPKLKVVGGSDA